MNMNTMRRRERFECLGLYVAKLSLGHKPAETKASHLEDLQFIGALVLPVGVLAEMFRMLCHLSPDGSSRKIGCASAR